MTLRKDRVDCQCPSCVRACRHSPGWLSPGDVRKLARHLGVTEQSLFVSRLCWAEWHEFDERTRKYADVFVAMPCSEVVYPGTVVEPYLNVAQCRQLTPAGACGIHRAKPRECREVYGGSDCPNARLGTRGGTWLRAKIARAWARPAARRYATWLMTGGEELADTQHGRAAQRVEVKREQRMLARAGQVDEGSQGGSDADA